MTHELLPALLIVVSLAVAALGSVVFRVRDKRRTPALPAVSTGLFLRALDLTIGMRLADRSRVAAVIIGERGDLDGTGVDRSAGRHCRTCDRHGTHHTDTHDEFMAVSVLVITPDGTTAKHLYAGTETVEVAPSVLAAA